MRNVKEMHWARQVTFSQAAAFAAAFPDVSSNGGRRLGDSRGGCPRRIAVQAGQRAERCDSATSCSFQVCNRQNTGKTPGIPWHIRGKHAMPSRANMDTCAVGWMCPTDDIFDLTARDKSALPKSDRNGEQGKCPTRESIQPHASDMTLLMAQGWAGAEPSEGWDMRVRSMSKKDWINRLEADVLVDPGQSRAAREGGLPSFEEWRRQRAHEAARRSWVSGWHWQRSSVIDADGASFRCQRRTKQRSCARVSAKQRLPRNLSVYQRCQTRARHWRGLRRGFERKSRPSTNRHPIWTPGESRCSWPSRALMEFSMKLCRR